jgi:hypothetical protein
MPQYLGAVKREKALAYCAFNADGSCAGCFLVVGTGAMSMAVDKAHVHARDGGECLYMPNAKAQSLQATLAYVDWLLRMRHLVAGDLLLMDRSNSFTSVEVQNMLDDAGVLFLYYPAGWGSLLDVCDNSIFAWIEREHYKRLVAEPVVTPAVTVRCWYDAYNSVPESQIINCYRHVGILGDEDPSAVVARLSEAGYHTDSHFQDMHNEQLEAFDDWNRLVRFLHRGQELTGDPTRGVGEVTQDGLHWNNWRWQHD